MPTRRHGWRTSSSVASSWSAAANPSRRKQPPCGASSKTRPTSWDACSSRPSGVEDRASQRAEQGRLRRRTPSSPTRRRSEASVTVTVSAPDGPHDVRKRTWSGAAACTSPGSHPSRCTPRQSAALCDEHLAGRYEIEIVDLAEHPERAQIDNIVAIPTLIRCLPEPVRRIIGDLSNTDRVLVNLRSAPASVALAQKPERPAVERETSYDLTLFVSGASDLAARAITNARRLCETHLAGQYRLTVIDVYEDLAALLASEVLATPTLVKNLPLPVRKIVGDLSHVDRVLLALDLPAAEATARMIG